MRLVWFDGRDFLEVYRRYSLLRSGVIYFSRFGMVGKVWNGF